MARAPKVAEEDAESLAAAPHNVTSANTGTAILTGAGLLQSITIATLPANTDKTPLALIDSADGSPGTNLFTIDLQTLVDFLVEPRPGMPLTPGLAAPTYPKTIMGLPVQFFRGLWVQSCPVGPTFVVNA